MNSEEIAWELIRTYFQDKGFVRSQINSFNELIYSYIPEIVSRLGQFTLTVNQTSYAYSFANAIFGVPSYQEPDGEMRHVTPQECRQRSLTYQFPIWCDLTCVSKNALNVETKYVEKVMICYLPCMLKSELCVLRNRTEKEMAELGECMYDHGGYFVVNGGEKVLIAQERMAHNQVFCYLDKFGAYTAELRSVPEGVAKAATQVTVKYNLQKSNKLLFNSLITVCLHHMKKEVPVVLVFRALGVVEVDEIIKYISVKREPDVIRMLQASFEECNVITTQQAALRYLGANAKTVNTGVERQIDYARNNIMLKEFFPHLGTEEKHNKVKAFLLGHMVYKCLLTAQNKRDVDDRDHLGNKRMDLSGNLIGNIFRIAFTRAIKEFKKRLESKINNSKSINFQSDFDFNTVTKQIRSSISTGNWGTNNNNKSPRTGVTQTLHRLTYISTLANIRRLVAPIAKEGKLAKPRQLHNSLFARCDAHDTPEGAAVGLTKNMSLMSEITTDVSSAAVRFFLFTQSLIPVEELIDGCKVFVNGTCVGISREPAVLYDELKQCKLNGTIDLYTGIVWNRHENEISVITDGGRSIRPVFYVQSTTPEEFAMRLGKALREGKKWDDLCRMKLLEYLDGREEEQTFIAMRWEDWREAPTDFTHLEIHPAIMMGVCASTIPMSNHNQAPRVSYQSSQVKQALGIYSMNYQTRFDTQSHVMWYPQKPLMYSKMGELLKVNDMPAGQTCIVAIMCNTG